jgi:hypothetical protein
METPQWILLTPSYCPDNPTNKWECYFLPATNCTTIPPDYKKCVQPKDWAAPNRCEEGFISFGPTVDGRPESRAHLGKDWDKVWSVGIHSF